MKKMYVRKKIYLFLLFRALFFLNICLWKLVSSNHIPLGNKLEVTDFGSFLEDYETTNDISSEITVTHDDFIPSTAIAPQEEACDNECSKDYGELPPGGSEDKVLYIGGLFDFSCSCKTGINGNSELVSAELAVSHINQFNFIPGYKLQLLYNNTQCDAGIATDAFYDFIYRRRHKIIMLMGSACADVTKTIAEIVPYWNLIMISHATTSPALSERLKYSTFFRLSPGDSSLNPARRMFIQHFRWNTVAALYEDKDLYALAITDMSEHFEVDNITLRPTIAFKDTSEIPEKMKHLKEQDVRIIIGGFSDQAARQVFCEAYKLGMYGARYVWILIGGYTWLNLTSDTTCTPHQIKKAMAGFITVSSVKSLHNEGKTLANLSSAEFLTDGSQPKSMYAETSYDTMWTIALTIKSALHSGLMTEYNVTESMLSRVNYTNIDGLMNLFYNLIEQIKFQGVSGPVSFQGPDRVGIVAVYQHQGDRLQPIAIHDPAKNSLQFNCSKCVNIVWQGDRIPRDKKIIRHRQATISTTVFYVSCVFCAFGVIMAVCFLVFNLYYRKLRYIKLSSPMLNDVAVIGCILVYTAVIVLGLDDAILPRHVFPFICTIRVLLFAAGFSLAFGAMFAKTYRVHQIFTRAHTGLVKSKLLRDKHLLFMIGTLLLIDSAIVFVWVLADPMERQITNLTSEASAEDEDIWYISQLVTCHSSHLQKWTGAFYVYKGLLLIFGVYMAWETRSVKIPALNDSQYIGMNVYNVVIMSISVVVLSNILAMEPTLAYAVESSFMFLSTTVTLCLLFVPKIYAIVTSGGNPVIASSGIHVEANTRRFVIDDRKEIYYRAEVQNRVYKRELVEAEQELSRLRRLMELPIEPFSRMTDELLHLLPESKVDGTPAIQRRRQEERRMYLNGCNSISDDGEVCYGSEETDGFPEVNAGNRLSSPRVSQKRHSAQENSGESTLKKLCRISRSLSITQASPLNYRQGKNLDVASPRSPRDPLDSEYDSAMDELSFNVAIRNDANKKTKRNSEQPSSSPKANRYFIGFENFGRFNNITSNPDQRKCGFNGYVGNNNSDMELNLIQPACTEDTCNGGRLGKDIHRIENNFSDSSFSVQGGKRKLHSPPPHVRIKHVITKCDIKNLGLPLRRVNQYGDQECNVNKPLDNICHLDLQSLTLTHEHCDQITPPRNAHVNNDIINSNLYNHHKHSSPIKDAHAHQSLSEQSSSSSYSNEISTETMSSTSPSSPKHDTITTKPFGAKTSSFKMLPQRHLGTITEKDGSLCKGEISENVLEPVHDDDMCTGAVPKDVQAAQRKHRTLCRVDSARTVERRMKIRKLQSDLLRIQQELQDLDEMEFDVSEV